MPLYNWKILEEHTVPEAKKHIKKILGYGQETDDYVLKSWVNERLKYVSVLLSGRYVKSGVIGYRYEVEHGSMKGGRREHGGRIKCLDYREAMRVAESWKK